MNWLYTLVSFELIVLIWIAWAVYMMKKHMGEKKKDAS